MKVITRNWVWIVVALVLVAGVGAYRAVAEPLFSNRSQTNTATSTLVYMTPGRATTTVSLVVPANTIYQSASINMQVVATSTGIVGGPLMNVRVEGSHDNQDWYPITVLETPTTTAATTFITNPYQRKTITFSTSTPLTGDYAGNGDAQHIHQSFDVPALRKYLRVVFSDPASGGNYGLYAEIIGNKESQ